MLLIEYPKCSTCQKAKKYLESNKIEFIDRNIIEDTPTKEELLSWINKYQFPINKLYNTSGQKYRELNIKEKREKMPLEEQLELLSSDGMLLKRPILITKDKMLTGFKEKEWEEAIDKL